MFMSHNFYGVVFIANNNKPFVLVCELSGVASNHCPPDAAATLMSDVHLSSIHSSNLSFTCPYFCKIRVAFHSD